MNLLQNDWISVSRQKSGEKAWISFKTLMSTAERWELCYPRDDFEMAALQLLISMVQIIFMPVDEKDWKHGGRTPIAEDQFDNVIEEYVPMFELEDPVHPFMQTRGVKAIEPTPMEKLLPGVNSSTNSDFINDKNLGRGLCEGCTCIALFNQASNAPGFGGGFKAGLRGSSPITVFVQGNHLFESIWLNVLDRKFIENNASYISLIDEPTWIKPIEKGSEFISSSIGLFRGLFWQPAHIELESKQDGESCSCCGKTNVPVYKGFYKEKFNYTINGSWRHPHSAIRLNEKNGVIEKKYLSFTTSVPGWTKLGSMIVKQDIEGKDKQGSDPAFTIEHYKESVKNPDSNLVLAIGGYRNNQASILERRHEQLSLNKSLFNQLHYVNDVTKRALEYKTELRKSLYVFSKGYKDVKGAGVELSPRGENLFYNRTGDLMNSFLAVCNFQTDELRVDEVQKLEAKLKTIVLDIFDELTNPYLDNPHLIRAAGIARLSLIKKIKDFKKQ